LFARIGEGTLALTEPPKQLVIAGFFRYSRNPVYLADLSIIFGEFLFFGHLALLLYLAAAASAVHALLVCWEEPELRGRFGEEYDRYVQTVPRWFPIRLP